MRILEIGHGPFLSASVPGSSDFYSIYRVSAPGKSLTFRRLLSLRRRLREGAYDLVVYHVSVKVLAPWHQNRPVWRVFFDVLSASVANFHKIGWHYFHQMLLGTDTPLVIIDTQDVPRLTRTEARWLDRARFYFMRELPPNHMNVFLNMDRRCGDVINVQRNPKLRRNFGKLEPFGLGFHPHETLNLPRIEPARKIYDVFYAGKNHTSTVRQRGVEELNALKAAGMRVFVPENHLSRADFFEACAKSWLVWSPEGQGWDCYRHYEALMTYSVPLINYPTIEHLWPLRQGEHCLYYRPEPGGLREAVERALLDRDMLVKIAEQGRAYVLEHHARRQLARHVLAKVGLLEQAEPHLEEG